MQCEILWDHAMTRELWEDLLSRCPFSTLPQSYYYAQTMRKIHQQSSRHGIIVIDGREAGIVQMQEVSVLKTALHVLSIDRGPLWFEGFGTKDHCLAFAEELAAQFPDRLGRKRRFIPELSDDGAAIAFDNWNRNPKIHAYMTYVVDLISPIEEIRKELKQKWRNALSKAEKEPLDVQLDQNGATLERFLSAYKRDRTQKRYGGASSKFLKTMTEYALQSEDCYILNALEGRRVVGSMLFFKHGTSATYQAGWTSMTGRARGAHHLLLWRAMEQLKADGISHLDLGGHNEETTGIQKFKEGLGGHEIALIGAYK